MHRGIRIAALIASAQHVRGTVRDSTTGLPIAGAVITTMDLLDRVGPRSVTNERGSYFVTATGARRLRIVRLGFRPVDVDLAARRDSTAIDVAMARIPYQLQPVRVLAGARCPRQSDRTAALALLEQARAGLLATVVARSDKPARMTRLSIERWLDPETNRVMRQRVKIDSAPSGRRWRALDRHRRPCAGRHPIQVRRTRPAAGCARARRFCWIS